MGQSPRLLNAHVRVRLSPEARTARWSSGHLAWFSARRTPVRSRHGLPEMRMPPSSMGKIGDFHFPEPGSNPGGGTARWCNREHAGLIIRVMAVRIRSALRISAIRCSSTAEQRAVTPSMLVRDQPPERWRLSSVRVRAPGCRPGGRGFESRRRRHARLAQRKSARVTGGRAEGRNLQRVPGSCGVTDSASAYGADSGGSSPPGSAHCLTGSPSDRPGQSAVRSR
jgi:hypothetical protein